MTAELTQPGTRRSLKPFLGFALLTIGIFGLQFGLPWALDQIAYRTTWLAGTDSDRPAAHQLSWLLAMGVTLFVAQIVWQGRTGQTLGLSRSLFREIFLAVDSLFLVCWLPGVISILATPRHQRIGDLLADTIVVRDEGQIPH